MMLATRTALAPVRPAMGARSVALRPSLARQTTITRAKSSSLDTEELATKATAFANDTAAALKERWEKTEDKPAAVLIASGTVIALSLAFSLVNFVDKIPLISDLIELVGVGVTGWFVYRYLTVGPDRDELFISIKEFLTKVYGKL